MSDFFFSFIVMRVFDVKRFISDLSVAATPLTFEGLTVLILPFDIMKYPNKNDVLSAICCRC